MLVLQKKTGIGAGGFADWTDFSAYSYDSVNVPLAGGVTDGRAMEFSPDGTRMFLAGNGSNPHYVAMWTLSTPWDLSTASLTNNIGLSTGDLIMSIRIKPDGTTMLLSQYSSRVIESYTMSTPWNVTTALYTDESPVIAGTRMSSFDITSDGSRGYIVMRDVSSPLPFETGTEYRSISTPWNIATLATSAADGINMDPTSYNADVRVHPNGNVMLRVETYHITAVQRYTLGTQWLPSTITYQDALDVSTQASTPMAAYISPDATKMYVLDQSNGVFQYSK